MKPNHDPGFSASSLVDLLRTRTLQQPDSLVYTFLADGEKDEANITYSQLDRRARAIAALLADMDVVDERALLLYPPGLEFIEAFFGCLYAGVIAVPVYPPRLNRPSQRIQAIVADAQATVALTTGQILEKIERRFEHMPNLASLRWSNTDQVTDNQADEWRDPDTSSEDLAFLQYTSGSTNSPKGVKVSHGNLLHNLAMINQGFQLGPQDKGVFWLPSYHDMGLIGGILEPMYTACTSILMSPTAFLQQPIRWLQAITRYEGTITGGPNFAYQLCVDKVSPEQLETLNLSSLQVAFCGAEPIRKETLEAFADKFEPIGFSRSAFYPCYGLAEATLLVSGGEGPSSLVSQSFQKEALSDNLAVAADSNEDSALTIVSCGRTLLDQKIAIANPDSLVSCKGGEIGEIWLSSPSVAQGYWNRPELSKSTFQAYLTDTGEGPFLRTGDLGFLRAGELYVTGRVKDLIIIRGRNHYPHDIELTVERCHPAIQPGSGAAFSIDIQGEEHLVIAYELARSHRRANAQEVISAARRAVSEDHNLQLQAMILLKPFSIPKTSSGKIRRHACREAFLADTLNVLGEWRVTKKSRSLVSVKEANEKPRHRDMGYKSSRSKKEIEDWLITHLALESNITLDDISVQEPFASYGLDSLQAVSITGDLESWLERKLSPTLAWDYPTIAVLAGHLANHKEEHASGTRIEMERDNEPIAIIGLACRFPGASNIEAFWELLHDGVDAIREVPPERWDIEALYDSEGDSGKMTTRWGGFIDDVGEFDAQFFGISPREAARMDPQQRLLLESAWTALENAAVVPDSLSGSSTGVFVGISSYDYSRLQFSSLNTIDAYAGTGNAHSVAANRLSYTLDLRGPSFAVDTACSSSLVAVHLAMRSLRDGESDLALAGGVNLLLGPELTIAFSQARMMSADGRCKTFDAQADGYVRGEGCGMIVLKRLSDAVRDGDNIVALLRGSAVNQDGKSNGLTAPNGLAQQAVIREALANARLEASDIDYVETHGTGTPLGDPIEVHSLRAVIDEDGLRKQPCYIGSVKTNFGHLEAAAGMAGLIKVILALDNQEIPAHLHFNELNPYIDLADSSLIIANDRQPWPRNDKTRLAGVSSFGFGGTNAHLIVSDWQTQSAKGPEDELPSESSHKQQAPKFERPLHLLALSAKSEPALRELASHYVSFLQKPNDESVTPIKKSRLTKPMLANICFTAAHGRSHFKHRLAIAADNIDQIQHDLSKFISSSELSSPDNRVNDQRLAFLFTGQGSQYENMGRQLYESQSTFRIAIDRCAEILEDFLDQPLLSVLYPTSSNGSGLQARATYEMLAKSIPQDGQIGHEIRLNETIYTQPALFAVEYALAELWRSWGIEPDLVMGHSVGEYVAAFIAGIFTLEDALRLVAARGRLMQALAKNGQMAVVFASESQVAATLEPFKAQVNIASINGPENVVISGEVNATKEVLDRLAKEEIESRPLDVSHAFHSPLMEPMLDEFERIAGQIQYNTPRIPIVSNVAGRLLTEEEIQDASYWRRHARNPVQFAGGIRELDAQEVTTYLEIGPQPHLTAMGRRSLPKSKAAWLPSLRRGQDDWQAMLSSLGVLYINGASIDWAGFDKDYPRRKVTLPTYPFERQRHWLDVTPSSPVSPQAMIASDTEVNPYLGRRLRVAIPIYESQFDPADVADLQEIYKEMALAAAVDLFGPGKHQLQDMSFVNSRQASGRATWQTIATAESELELTLQILSKTEKQSSWKLRANSRIQKGEPLKDSMLEVEPEPVGHEEMLAKLPNVESPQNYLKNEAARILGLEVSKMDVDTPLDSLGMDSLMAIEFRNSIESDLRVTLPVVNFLQGPTISDLTEQLKNHPSETELSDAVIRPISGSKEMHPLPHGQQAMWFLQQLMPQNAALNVSGAVNLFGALDTPGLREALRKLIERHSALRTVFTTVNGQPMFIVRDQIDTPFYEIDATTWAETQVQAYLEEQAHSPFDLEKGPLLRLVILQRSSTKSVLLLSINHTIADFWSMSLIAQELYLLYEAERSGTPALLPQLDLEYSDFAYWQEKMLSNPEGKRLREYWLSLLSGELPLLNLPTDRSRPPMQTFRGDAITRLIDSDLTVRLSELGQENGATLYMTLLAAFQLLLHRFTSQEDFLTGSVLSGRDRAELAGLVGYFLNPVVIRADFSGDPSFNEHLERVRLVMLKTFENQNYPLSLLAEHLRFERDPSRPPLFETMFIMQKAQLMQEHGLSAFALGIPGAHLELGELVAESRTLGNVPAQFDLTLMMAELDDGLAASFHYNMDLFDSATVERMLDHFNVLLRSIVNSPNKSVSSIHMLTEGEKQRLLLDWNKTTIDYPREILVHQAIEAQAGRRPDEVAVIHDGQTLTYRQLNERANKLAHYLRELGIGPEVLVGIGLERSADMLVALLGVLKAGGAYIPLDPDFPNKRLSLMLSDAQPAVLLTHEHLLQSGKWNIPNERWSLISLDKEWPTISQYSSENPKSLAEHENLAYIIYTSGSTGRPKGVQISHGALNNFLTSMAERPGMDSGDTLLAVTTLSFDIAALELFLPLTLGARVEVASHEVGTDGIQLRKLLSDSGATVMQATPSTWQMLLDVGWSGDNHLKILCGGEALGRDLANKLLARCAELWNMYGPTETTIWSTIYRVSEGEGPVSIGRPISNTQLYILDNQLQPVPVGVAGDLYIGGDGVSRGYLNRPRLTAERFLNDSYVGHQAGMQGLVPPTRLYKTGDLAKYRADGNVIFLGRDDHQVKVNGYRIELGDIEAMLSQHPAVRQKVVIVRDDATGDKRLIAYLLFDPEQLKPSVSELRDFLRALLPDYMIPSIFVELDSLPLTPNGKVDRKRLPPPSQDHLVLTGNYVEPRSELERELAELCASVLGLERVGVLDSFFELGANSLLAVRLLYQVQEKYQVRMPLRRLFAAPTVSGLAAAVELARRADDTQSRLALFETMTLEELEAEAELDPSIGAGNLTYTPQENPKHVLLTGATGFVGAFMLHDLLKYTGATIHCLIRSSNQTEATKRLQRNMARYGLWLDSFSSRLRIVPGDLSQSRLGQTESNFSNLAETVEAIYHVGANVNFVYPYEALKAANVSGTQEILRLASQGELKPVHFVSTLAVHHTGGSSNGRVFFEDEDLVGVGTPFGGYAQSKWVAERMVLTALERGLPVAIYRPGLVTGHSVTGAWNTDDMISTLVIASQAMGALPKLDVKVDLVPVNYVSRAIITISQQPGSLNQIFHLANPRPMAYRDLLAWLNGSGNVVKAVSFKVWREKLIDMVSELGADAYIHLLEEVVEDQVYMPSVDCSNTLAALRETGVRCPPVDGELLDVYQAFLASLGVEGQEIH